MATDTRSRVTADPFRCDAGNYGEMGRALTEQLTGESCARNCARRRGTRGNSARKPHLKTNSLGVHSHPESHPERTHNPLVEGSNPSGPTSVPDQALPRISVVDSHLRQQPRRQSITSMRQMLESTRRDCSISASPEHRFSPLPVRTVPFQKSSLCGCGRG